MNTHLLHQATRACLPALFAVTLWTPLGAQEPSRSGGSDLPNILKGAPAMVAAGPALGAVRHQELASGLVSDPTAVSWSSGRIDVFARGADNALWHRYYSGSWSPWESLGGSITSAPDVSSWGANRLDIFARGADGALWHKWYDNGWRGWESLGGQIIGDPAAVSWGSGRIDVVIRGTDNAMYHKYYENGWSGYEPLGGAFTSGPDVSSWASGRLDVFGRGTDNTLYHKYWQGRWGPWEQLGPDQILGDPAAVSWGPDRIDVFVRGTDNQLYHKYWQNGWSAYESLGGALASGPDASSWAANRLDIFALGTDGSLQHRWYDRGWGGWEGLGAPAVQLASTPGKAHYRITLNGFSVGHETWDHALQVDGKRDEIFFTSEVSVVDKLNNTQVPSNMRSLTFGDINGFPYRVQAGSASSQGGIQTGDQIFGSSPWLRTGALQPNKLPMTLWEGDLIDGQNSAAIMVSVWEYDGGQDVYNSWLTWANNTANTLKGSTAFTNLIGAKGTQILELTQLGIGAALSLSDSGIVGNAFDRPIGFVSTGTTTYTFSPKLVPLNYNTAEAFLANDFGMGKGIFAIRYVDAAKFAGDYTLYLQVERVP